MIKLESLRFIPQKNVEVKSPSDEDLIQIKKKEIIDYDLKFSAEKGVWTLKKDFLKNQGKDFGWTSAIDDDTKTFILFQTNTSSLEEMKPLFCKGENCTNKFKSNYFNFLALKAGLDLKKDLYLFLEEEETGIEGVRAWYISSQQPVIITDAKIPVKNETIIEEDLTEKEEELVATNFELF